MKIIFLFLLTLISIKVQSLSVQEKQLFKAVQTENLKSVKSLIQNHHMDLNIKDRWGNKLIIEASKNEMDEIFNYLLTLNVNLDVKDSDGKTILHYLTQKNKHELVKKVLLLNSGLVNVKDKDGNTALHVAAEFGGKESIHVLLKFKADLSLKNKNNKTPFQIAKENNLQETVRILNEKDNP